jgi:hypothetical protein
MSVPRKPVPTRKQMKFAAGVVAGVSKAAAYRAAYPDDTSSPKTQRANALKAAQKAAVQAEIARLEREQLPPYGDLAAIHRFSVGILLKLARDGEKESERRQAAQYLESYARSGLTLRIGEAVKGEDADQDLAALRAIFQTAGVYSGAGGEVLELETVRTDADGNEIPVKAEPPDPDPA